MSKKLNLFKKLSHFKQITVSLFLLTSFHISAIQTTHLIKPHTSFASSTLSNSCSTMHSQSFSTRCNMALFPFQKKNNMSFSVVGKSDGDSIDNGKDLIFSPITENLLRKLFEKSNYNSFTFASEVSFKNSLFEITYVPYYLLADLYIFNPVFPEISMNLVNREELRISSGKILYGNGDLKNSTNLSLGGSFFYYSHTSANSLFSLFDLSNTDPKELIKFNSIYGVSSDISLFLSLPNQWIPNFALQYKNIGSKINRNKQFAQSATRLQTNFLFDDYILFGIGKSYHTMYGQFSYNLEIPTLDYFQDIDFQYLNLGLNYSLKLLSLFLSLGRNYQTLGVSFNAEKFDVGISYTKEKDLGDIQKSYDDSAYIGVSINL